MNKLTIRIKAVSPPPPVWRAKDAIEIFCARCQCLYQVERRKGIFAKELQLRSGTVEHLLFCDLCGQTIADAVLLVVSEDKNESRLREALKTACALRQGQVTSFGGVR